MSQTGGRSTAWHLQAARTRSREVNADWSFGVDDWVVFAGERSCPGKVDAGLVLGRRLRDLAAIRSDWMLVLISLCSNNIMLTASMGPSQRLILALHCHFLVRRRGELSVLLGSMSPGVRRYSGKRLKGVLFLWL